jgi:hypothetical protein
LVYRVVFFFFLLYRGIFIMKPLLFRDILPTVLVPPVTGVHGNNRPYANSFDHARVFRDRAGSGVKRARRDGQDELLDAVYDLTRDFPPVVPPDRPALDVAAIKNVLVEATTMVDGLRPVLEREDASNDSKAIVRMLQTLVNLVGAVVEKGIEPISAAVVGVAGNPTGRGFASAARRLANPPLPQPKPPTPGKRELIEALEKSDKEAVLFGANLGAATMAHRGSLNANLTADLQRKVVSKAEGKPEAQVNESLRIVEDALSCVENLEFMGQRTQPYINAREGATGEFCSMPVKLSFQDRDSRINFERSIRDHTGLRVIQSLPRPVREEMAVFRKAMEERYPGKIIMTRPNLRTLEYIALMKDDGEKRWTDCLERHPIPLGVMLPNFVKSSGVVLPDVGPYLQGGEGGEEMEEDGAAGGGS